VDPSPLKRLSFNGSKRQKRKAALLRLCYI